MKMRTGFHQQLDTLTDQLADMCAMAAEAIKHLVGSGCGIGCLSQRVVQAELERDELVRLGNPLGPLRRTFFRALHVDKYSTQGLRRFLDYAEAWAALNR